MIHYKIQLLEYMLLGLFFIAFEYSSWYLSSLANSWLINEMWGWNYAMVERGFVIFLLPYYIKVWCSKYQIVYCNACWNEILMWECNMSECCGNDTLIACWFLSISWILILTWAWHVLECCGVCESFFQGWIYVMRIITTRAKFRVRGGGEGGFQRIVTQYSILFEFSCCCWVSM